MRFKLRYVFIKIVIALGLSYLPDSLMKSMTKVQEAGGDITAFSELFDSAYEWWRIGFFLSGYFAVTLLSILWSKGKLISAVLAGFFCFAIAGAFVMTSIGFYVDIQNGARTVNIGTIIGWGITVILLLWAPIYDIVSATKKGFRKNNINR